MDLRAATMMAPDWRVDDVVVTLIDSASHEPRGTYYVNDQIAQPTSPATRDVTIAVFLARRDDAAVRVRLETSQRSPWTTEAYDEVQRLCRLATTPPRPTSPKMCEEHGRPLAECVGEDGL